MVIGTETFSTIETNVIMLKSAADFWVTEEEEHLESPAGGES